MSSYIPAGEARVNAAAPDPVAGAHLGTDPHVAAVNPISSPFEAGLLGNSASALMNHRPPPPHGGDSFGGSGVEDGPLDLGGVSDVVGDALAGGGGEGSSGGEKSGSSGAPARPMPVNDADHPLARGAILTGSDGNLHHVRPMGDGGMYSSQVGGPGDGAP